MVQQSLAPLSAFDSVKNEKHSFPLRCASNEFAGFLRKVFGIVGIQLLITTLTSAYVILWPGAKDLVRAWPMLPMIGLFASIGLLLTMMVLRHQTPINYVLLTLWTAVEAYTVAAIGSILRLSNVYVTLMLIFSHLLRR